MDTLVTGEWPVGGEELVCRRDGGPTRLRCAKCDAGICPECLVRTPVGYKCPGCAGEPSATRRWSRTRLLVMATVAFVTLGGAVTLLRSPGVLPTDPVAVAAPTAEPVATRQAMLGEEVRDGQLVFVVDEFACSAKQPASRICTLRFNVKNASSSPAMMLGRFQYLVDPQRRTYGADDALTRAVPENGNRSLSELNINPDVMVPMTFVFDLPAGVEPAEAQFRGTGRSRVGVSVRLERR